MNIPKPAELLQIYREYMKANGYDKLPSVSVGVQTDFCELEPETEAEKDEFKEMVCRSYLWETLPSGMMCCMDDLLKNSIINR